jgi:hypothetical protein
MKAPDVDEILRKRLGKPPEQLTAREGIAAMCSFYVEERADGAAIGSDRDMLLYQWGVNTFDSPPSFELSITRQINVIGESQPYRLMLIFHYQPTNALRNIGTGNEWCRAPGDVLAFRQFVDASDAFKAVDDAKADRVELQLLPR